MKNKKGNIFVVIIIFVVLASVAGAIGFLFAKKQVANRKQKTKQEANQVGSQINQGRFIYVGSLDDRRTPAIKVSDADGGNPIILKVLDKPKGDDFFYYTSPSPKGKYFLRQSGKDSVVMDLSGSVIFSLPEKLEYGDPVSWSSDEKYLAFVKKERDESIVVFDIQGGKQVLQESVGSLKKAEVGDPIQTNPKVIWGEKENTLYSFNELGIKIITNFDTNPIIKMIETKVPCLGIAPHKNEFYCHGRMNTIFSDGVKNPANSTSTGSVFKYILNGDSLSGPESVTSEPLDGEYESNLTFLDETHILFTPLLGSNSVVDIKNGNVADADSNSKFKIFSNSGGAIESDRREATTPIIYQGL